MFAHEFLQIVELLHSLSKVFLKGFIPLLDWILFRVAFGVSNGEFFGASSSIVYFLGKFSKLFLLTVCLKALIKSHLIKGLDEAEFPRLRWSNDHHIKVVNLCFFRDILSEESIVSKIRLLQKCVHIWKGRVWFVVWLVSIVSLAKILLFKWSLFKIPMLVYYLLICVVKILFEAFLNKKLWSFWLTIFWVVLAKNFLLNVLLRFLKDYLLGQVSRLLFVILFLFLKFSQDWIDHGNVRVIQISWEEIYRSRKIAFFIHYKFK